MKRPIYCIVMSVFMVFLLFEVSWGEKILFTKHFQNTLFDVTAHSIYSVEILLDDQEYNIGKNVIGIVIHDAHDKDVAGAELSFILKDSISGKALPINQKTKDKGNGLYIVSGLDLRNEDQRELTIVIKKDGAEDLVKFTLPDAYKARVPKGKYSP